MAVVGVVGISSNPFLVLVRVKNGKEKTGNSCVKSKAHFLAGGERGIFFLQKEIFSFCLFAHILSGSPASSEDAFVCLFA